MTLTRRESVDVSTVLNMTAKHVDDDDDDDESSTVSLEYDDAVPDLVNEDAGSINATTTSFDGPFQLSPTSGHELDSFLNSSSGMDFDNYRNRDLFPVDDPMRLNHQGSTMQLTREKPNATADNINTLDFAPSIISAKQSIDPAFTHTDEVATSPKFILSIVDPSSEVVRDVVGVLVTSRAKFQSEMHYSD